MKVFDYLCPSCMSEEERFVSKDEQDAQMCEVCEVEMIRKFPTPFIPRNKTPYDLLDSPDATRASGMPARVGRGRGRAKWRDKS